MIIPNMIQNYKFWNALRMITKVNLKMENSNA